MTDTRIECLKVEFDRWNQLYFDSKLELPILKINVRMRSAAGRFLGKKTVTFFGFKSKRSEKAATIEIASYLFTLPEADHHVRDTLGHEMIHYWLWIRGRPAGHTAEFRKKQLQMGVSRYNTVPVKRDPKYVYICRSCQKEYPAFRRWKEAACLSCCRRHNQGRFDRRFLLLLNEGAYDESKFKRS